MKSNALALALICTLFTIPPTVYAATTKLNGCVYDKKTNIKIVGTFVIRHFFRNGDASAAAFTGGCYNNFSVISAAGFEHDFIEVLYKKIAKSTLNSTN